MQGLSLRARQPLRGYSHPRKYSLRVPEKEKTRSTKLGKNWSEKTPSSLVLRQKCPHSEIDGYLYSLVVLDFHDFQAVK